jgi:transposase
MKSTSFPRNRLSRRTVKRYMAAETLPLRKQGWSTQSKVTPFWNYIQQRWHDGCHNIKQLFQELTQQGFSGSYASGHRAVRRRLPRAEEKPNQPDSSPTPLSPRKAAWLLMRPLQELDDEDRTRQSVLQDVSSVFAHVGALAQMFTLMVRNRQGSLLDLWLAYAEGSGVIEIYRFAQRLRQDYDALKAGVSLPWSNGPVEGHVHRLKLIKRQMYGRANFELLRKRVLYAL